MKCPICKTLFTNKDERYAFSEGFNAGVEEMKQRAEVLVKAIDKVMNYKYYEPSYGAEERTDNSTLKKALEQYKESMK